MPPLLLYDELQKYIDDNGEVNGNNEKNNNKFGENNKDDGEGKDGNGYVNEGGDWISNKQNEDRVYNEEEIDHFNKMQNKPFVESEPKGNQADYFKSNSSLTDVEKYKDHDEGLDSNENAVDKVPDKSDRDDSLDVGQERWFLPTSVEKKEKVVKPPEEEEEEYQDDPVIIFSYLTNIIKCEFVCKK